MCKKMIVMIMLVVVMIMMSGCDGGFSFTTNGSVFYPNMQTAKGGTFGDPGGRGKNPAFISGSASNESTSTGFGKWKK